MRCWPKPSFVPRTRPRRYPRYRPRHCVSVLAIRQADYRRRHLCRWRLQDSRMKPDTEAKNRASLRGRNRRRTALNAADMAFTVGASLGAQPVLLHEPAQVIVRKPPSPGGLLSNQCFWRQIVRARVSRGMVPRSRPRGMCRLSEDLHGHIVPISDLLPANEEVGEDASGMVICQPSRSENGGASTHWRSELVVQLPDELLVIPEAGLRHRLLLRVRSAETLPLVLPPPRAPRSPLWDGARFGARGIFFGGGFAVVLCPCHCDVAGASSGAGAALAGRARPARRHAPG